MIEVAKITLLVLAIMCSVGGIIGFVKAKSKPSLIAGQVSFLLLAACYGITWLSPTMVSPGLIAGDVISFLLALMFFFRYSKSRKFMPSGLMIVLSMLSVVIVTMALVRG